MGKSNRSRKRRDSLTNFVAPSKYRFVPYARFSKKKFSALRAGDYTNPRRGRNTNKRNTHGPTISVIKNPQRRTRSVPSNVYSLRSLSGTVVLDTAKAEKRSVRSVRTVCEKRSTREQVMHALHKTGKVGQKTPRWTILSKRKCK